MSPGAVILRDYMSDLSEQAWHAAWMTDVEYALWNALEHGPRRYGRLALSEHHIAKLRELSTACGGWIRFDDAADGEVFVPMEAWMRHVAERAADASRPEQRER